MPPKLKAANLPVKGGGLLAFGFGKSTPGSNRLQTQSTPIFSDMLLPDMTTQKDKVIVVPADKENSGKPPIHGKSKPEISISTTQVVTQNSTTDPTAVELSIMNISSSCSSGESPGRLSSSPIEVDLVDGEIFRGTSSVVPSATLSDSAVSKVVHKKTSETKKVGKVVCNCKY